MMVSVSVLTGPMVAPLVGLESEMKIVSLGSSKLSLIILNDICCGPKELAGKVNKLGEALKSVPLLAVPPEIFTATVVGFAFGFAMVTETITVPALSITDWLETAN